MSESFYLTRSAIRDIRKHYRYSQEDFARVIGIHKSSYSRKESGIIEFSLEEANAILRHVRSEHPNFTLMELTSQP